jgi:hypothetical protein
MVIFTLNRCKYLANKSGLTTRWSGRLKYPGDDAESICRRSAKPLTIFVEFGDEHSGRIVLGSFARLYQATHDEGIVADVAQCLNTTPEEVKSLFENLTDG